VSTGAGQRGPARRVAIVSASVGAGHDGAAGELASRLRDAGFLVDTHDFLDLLGDRAGRALRGSYAAELRIAPNSWGWIIGQLERREWLATAIRALFARGAASRSMAAMSRTDDLPEPSVIVSTYPLASQALGRLRKNGELSAPVVTYLTDLSVHPLWVAEGIDLHLALHEVAATDARRLSRGFVEVCRPAVRPAFHPVTDPDEPTRTRARYGLPATGRIALVVAGSWGVGEVAESAMDLAATGLATVVTVCGRNTRLRERLARSGTGIPLGWVDDMAALIRASDVVVQNAGGLTSLEAMATEVPVITYRCLPGHGATNARALAEAGLATWVRDRTELHPVLADVLDGQLGKRQLATAGELFDAPCPITSIRALANAASATRPAPRRSAAPGAGGRIPAARGTESAGLGRRLGRRLAGAVR
jgi:UDP-N-acetylglucosamine:LPS N-acetylglucosamine transferase